MFEVTDTQKIGVGLAGFGMFFLFLGVLLLFDKSLLALGNILFIAGLACVIGLERTFRFFFQRHKIKASIAFFGGITIVLLGWPLVGMLVETYGFVLLFRHTEIIMFLNEYERFQTMKHLGESNSSVSKAEYNDNPRKSILETSLWPNQHSHQLQECSDEQKCSDINDNNASNNQEISDSGKRTLNEFQLFARIVEVKLKRMDKTQQLLAEILIHKVLLKGVLGNLTGNTDVTDGTTSTDDSE